MSGLGTVREGGRSTFLSLAGGFIWDRKAEADNPNYATQSFDRADGTTGERAGARYADLTGTISKVEFKQHPQFGENVNVTIEANGEKFIMSVSTNNRYSQDVMKMLLCADLSQPIFVKPYDFVGKDKRRAQGVSFRQNGEKLALRVEGSPSKDAEWFKTAGTKNIKRFFEDLSEWYVSQVTEKVVGGITPPQVVAQDAPQEAPQEVEQELPPVVKPPVKKAKQVDSSSLDDELDALLG